MKRRAFLQASTTAALLPFSNAASAAGLAPTIQPAYLFVDERFALAKVMNSTVLTESPRITVSGDVTAVWNQLLKVASQNTSLTLAGLTTSSFQFCLVRLLQTHCSVALTSERISQDVYSWSLVTTFPQRNLS